MTARIIGKSWWVDFRFAHMRYRRRSPENSRAGALAYEAVLRQRLARGDSIDREPAAEAPSFAAFAQRWFEDYVVANNKPSEQRSKTYILRASLIPFFGRMRIDEIATHHVERFKAKALREGATRKTVNNRLTVFNKCMSTACDWLALKGPPPKVAWLKCTSLRTDHLAPEESDRLLAAATGIVHDMILMGLHTGMRQGEIRGLQWSSIDWQNRSLAVQHSRSDYAPDLQSPKNHKVRHIPLSEELHAALWARRKDKGYVFLDEGRPYTSKRITAALVKARTKAKLRPFGWHVLRHTFASQLAMKGVPLSAVQALLGHSSITMTMRYAHLAPSTLRSAIDILTANHALPDFGQDVGNAAPAPIASFAA